MKTSVIYASPYRFIYKLLWLLPILSYQQEAFAWGLMTHVYYAESLLWAMPLLDPKLQAAIKKFPALVMAGACLPDLAIISKQFHGNHHWQHAFSLLQGVESEEETAIAIGYISHLYIDVIAHHHFVPAHEAMYQHHSLATHISAEWAMDAKLTPLLRQHPADLLKLYQQSLSQFTAKHFDVPTEDCLIAIKKLAFWDTLLRVSKIPQLIFACMRLRRVETTQHFVYYLAKTHIALRDFGQIFSGKQPHWQPELLETEYSASEWRTYCLSHLRLRYPLPIDYFNGVTSKSEINNY